MHTYVNTKKVIKEYRYLENEEMARAFLKQKYTQLGITCPDRVAYNNIFSFTTYIRQACTFFQTARHQDLWSKPLLLYYGMMSLAKAWVLTILPQYPQSTAVLRHGLSTRKRKKEHFRIIQDEVRVQKEGLFPLVAEKLGVNIEAGTIYTVKDLLAMIPDLTDDYDRIVGERLWIQIPFFEHKKKQEDVYTGTFLLPDSVLDQFHLTPEAFTNKLNTVHDEIVFRFVKNNGNQHLCFAWESPKHFRHPWFSINKKGGDTLWIGNHRPLLPELLVQWMLLFLLSMLCRYDPPLWGEIMMDHIYAEKTLIEELLYLVEERFPAIMLDYIYASDPDSFSDGFSSSSSKGTFAIVDTSSSSSVINLTP